MIPLLTDSIRCYCGAVHTHSYPETQYDGEHALGVWSLWCQYCKRHIKRRGHPGPRPPWGIVIVTAPVLMVWDVIRPTLPHVGLVLFGMLLGWLLLWVR